MVSILHVEPFENRGDKSLLTKTDDSTVFLAVDCDAEGLAGQAGIRDRVLFPDPGIDFDRSFGTVIWVHH